MDEVERYMSRARARWRSGKNRDSSLWGFENWATDRQEVHHVARKKYGDATLLVPLSMHRELTRRQMEEHPGEGPDSHGPLERQGRLFLGQSDIFECVADAYRFHGELFIAAARKGVQPKRE
jgi:hypothetical protein